MPPAQNENAGSSFKKQEDGAIEGTEAVSFFPEVALRVSRYFSLAIEGPSE